MYQHVDFSLKDSKRHTKSHCTRVLLYALMIAKEMNLSQELRDALGAAAAFHDSRRHDDWFDVGHGQRAADYYREYCSNFPLTFDERVYLVMAYHDLDDSLGEQALAKNDQGILLYRVFKDSDALDRYRVSPEALDLNYLRTNEAKKLTDFARELVEYDTKISQNHQSDFKQRFFKVIRGNFS